MSTLARLRLAYWSESHVARMTSSAPPTVRYLEQSRSGAWDVNEEEEPADANGQSLSAALVTLIGGITTHHDPTRCPDCQDNPLLNAQTTHYSNRHPFRVAMTQLERKCRREHRPPTWTDHPTPICADLFRLVVLQQYSIPDAAERVGVSSERATSLLRIGARDVTDSLRRHDNRLLGIKDDSHRLKDCPNPKGCPVCSESFSPSEVAREPVQPIQGWEKHTRGGDAADRLEILYEGT